MKLSSVKKLALVLTMLLISPLVHAQSTKDSVAIQTIIQDEDQAWNNGDATAYSRQFSPDGTFTNIAGMFFAGYKAFLDRHDEIFKSFFKNTVLKQKIVSLKFIRPDVVIVETLCRVSGFAKEGLPTRIQLDPKGQLNTRLLQVLTKESEGWKIVSYHNVDVKPGTPIPE